MELLRTPRLLLRHWEESDLPAFFDLYSRDDVMRWLGSHPRRTLATLDEARERLGRWRARQLDAPLGLYIPHAQDKVVIWLNGLLIGRYWEGVGPQHMFYLPAGLLHEHGRRGVGSG